MDDVDQILVKSYEAKFLKYSNSVLFPLYSGVLIFTGAIVVFLLNQTASITPIFSIAIILALILLYLAVAVLTLYFKAKYEEYNKKFKIIIIKEVAANSPCFGARRPYQGMWAWTARLGGRCSVLGYE